MTTARLGSVLLSEREAAARASSAHDARAGRGGAGPEALTPGRIVVVSSGVERAPPDGAVLRLEGAPHPTIELVAQGTGSLWLSGRR
ncbi:MAG TPA: hypothetical protein PLU22_26850, partial [Polyangiaceae bacterium]|nr:hypothetical protein [Polyangiaceae bacterium]